MQIEFPDSRPAYRSDNLTVSFVAHVDGRRVACAITVEALEDHFGADVADATEVADARAWLHAFDRGRIAIEAAARQHLMLSNAASILLKSGHFPPGPVTTVFRARSVHARPA
ncbi:DUF1488 domain-containing protein [Pararobbsia silviterrae]|uniref:DUF1488 domain-containing protein n=1 Tax=Pararobbsia silviterrae TaxID=1792498 RepID=A0A494X7G8_9BURK|nr:DUF1488 domain-containing protein [Pararobbsia silviterrae]RKP44246.1 DUF1488 domain-containing protein [Pararobbsia silviterrae]